MSSYINNVNIQFQDEDNPTNSNKKTEHTNENNSGDKCQICQNPFTLMRKKFKCTGCGKLICNSCSVHVKKNIE